MANDFKKGFVSGMSGSSGSPSTLYTVPSSKTSVLIELDCCNTSNASQTVTAILSHGGSTDVHLVKNVPIPAGSTLKVISGQKIVAEQNDVVKVFASNASSVDAVLSILEDVN
tara:strand:- start:710 stop:1048 length:339 start_codon:yes stop_codon:yes gene_type:complete